MIADASDRLRYLALGDSYTIGDGVPASSTWPMQLAHRLRAQRIPLADPHVIAQTGWTTDELTAALDAAEPLGSWDFVSLLIGVNNQYRDRGAAEYARDFVSLLSRALGYVGRRADRVLVLSIPDWGVTPFAFAQGRDRARIAEELDAFNAAARATCALRGVAFVDVTGVSRALGSSPTMLADDGLHPSAAMYGEWAELALPVAKKLLAGATA